MFINIKIIHVAIVNAGVGLRALPVDPAAYGFDPDPSPLASVPVITDLRPGYTSATDPY